MNTDNNDPAPALAPVAAVWRRRWGCSPSRSILSAVSGRLTRGKLALRGRRGTVSLYFAVSMITFFGIVGLGTEVGGWYVGKRNGQNAADAAAWAGVLMLKSNGVTSGTQVTAAISAEAIAAATNLASSNGFTTGGALTVTINNPPKSGPNTANKTAIEAIIQQTATPVLAALFVSNVTIYDRAVADLGAGLPACVLALGNGTHAGQTMLISGGGTINAPNCVVASNATDVQAVNLSGSSSSVNAGSIVTSGGCEANNNSCTGSSQVTLTDPPEVEQPATTDPSLGVQAVTLPTPTTAGGTLTCQTWPNNLTSGTVYTVASSYTYAGGGIICSPNNINISTTVNLVPGTYFFYNTALQVSGNGKLECTTCSPGSATTPAGAGVTLIFTGSTPYNVGAPLQISATTILNGPATSDFKPAFDGVLFFVTQNAPLNSKVQINGGANTTLIGALFFPSVEVDYTGSALAGVSSCTELVGDYVQITGTAQFALTECSPNTPKAQTAAGQGVQLAE